MLCLIIGAAVRIIWGLVIHPPLDFIFSDMQGYVDRAKRVASGAAPERYDAFYPPGGHILLSIPIKLFGPDRAGLWAGAVLWCALSIAVTWLAWWLARQLLTPVAAALTAAFCAFWPLYITYGAFFSSEVPSLAFMLAALCVAVRATRAGGYNGAIFALMAGILGGVAAAIRPQWMLNLLVVAALLLLKFRRHIAPLASFALGVALVLGLVVQYNSRAAHQLTSISENSGLVFFIGHCDAHDVTTVNKGVTFGFGPPPASQTNRGGSYTFEDRDIWDQAFFYRQGWDCIRRDGAHHLLVLAQNVVDMTVITIPWPQSNNAHGERDIVQAANLIYCALLPWIVIEALFLIRRRRRAGQPAGEAIMLAHLACAIPLAILTFGDPRYRSVYDVFGLALLAALLADRFHLDRSAAASAPSEPSSTTVTSTEAAASGTSKTSDG